MIVAGIIAPPDLSSQILPRILMSVLYEILIFTIPLPDTPQMLGTGFFGSIA